MWTVLATGAMTLGLMVGVTTSAQAETYYEIYNYKANKCLSLANGGSTANGTNIIIYTCNDGREQDWQLVESGAYPGYYYIKNYKAGTDQCISVSGGGSTADGAALILWTCNGGGEQRWRFDAKGGGWIALMNDKSGKAMSLDGASTANNTRAVQWEYFDTTDAIWRRNATIIEA